MGSFQVGWVACVFPSKMAGSLCLPKLIGRPLVFFQVKWDPQKSAR